MRERERVTSSLAHMIADISLIKMSFIVERTHNTPTKFLQQIWYECMINRMDIIIVILAQICG